MKISEEDYLKHSGILGQKWGIRHGPPYPLKQEDRSAEERRRNPKVESGKHAEVKKIQNESKKPDVKEKSSKEEEKKKEEPAVKQKPTPKSLKKLMKKDINDLSNDELRWIKERLELETAYKKAIENNKENTNKARGIVSKFASKMANNLVDHGAEIVAAKILSNVFGVSEKNVKETKNLFKDIKKQVTGKSEDDNSSNNKKNKKKG